MQKLLFLIVTLLMLGISAFSQDKKHSGSETSLIVQYGTANTLGGEVEFKCDSDIVWGFGYTKGHSEDIEDKPNENIYLLGGVNFNKIRVGGKVGFVANAEESHSFGAFVGFKLSKYTICTVGYDTINHGTFGIGLSF